MFYYYDPQQIHQLSKLGTSEKCFIIMILSKFINSLNWALLRNVSLIWSSAYSSTLWTRHFWEMFHYYYPQQTHQLFKLGTSEKCFIIMILSKFINSLNQTLLRNVSLLWSSANSSALYTRYFCEMFHYYDP